MKKIFSYCKPYTVFVALTLVIKTIGTVMDLIIPYLLGFILDEVAPKCTKENLTPIFFFGALMVLCAAVAVFTKIWANRRISLFSKNVIETLRSDLFRKILSLSSTQTDAFTVPSLVSRMSSDTYAIHHMLNMAFRGGIRAPLLILGGIGITLMIEPALSLTLIVLLPLMSIVVTVISKRSIKLFRLKQKNVDRMVEKVRDTFTGIRVIKALSKVDYEKESFHSINRTLSRSEEVANFTTAISPPAITFLLNLGTTSVVAVGALLVQYGHSTPGQIISFMSYFSIILNSTLMLTRIFNLFSRGAASADRIREVLDEKEDLLLAKIKEEENAPFLDFRSVTFSYNKKRPNLKNISFRLEKGQTLGILGGTGSGKSTLIQLLLRFYDPDSGKILLEGKDLRSIPPKELKAKFGVVFQNDFLMADTLKENILFTRDLSEENVEKGAKNAMALPFISSLDDAFEHTLTSKGQNLSGGQRQRVLISRALAGNPEILILDDASSALDYKTDALLRSALKDNYQDTTKIIVAQRISSIREADLILVLENGEICGAGNDEFLSKECPIYREIASSQMGEMQL